MKNITVIKGLVSLPILALLTFNAAALTKQELINYAIKDINEINIIEIDAISIPPLNFNYIAPASIETTVFDDLQAYAKTALDVSLNEDINASINASKIRIKRSEYALNSEIKRRNEKRKETTNNKYLQDAE